MSAGRLRVAYVGTHDEGGRNAIVQAALRAAGVEVLDCRAPLWRDTGAKLGAARAIPAMLGAAPRLLTAWFELARRYRALPEHDLVIVGSTAHLDLPLVRRLARRAGRPLVFDPLISIGETLRDRGLLPPPTPA